MGYEIIVHETVGHRAAWGLNGVKGWYIGPYREHYRCYQAYIPSTRGERIAMTVDWHTTTTKIPHVSPADAAINAAKDLTAALAHPPNTA
eukprot:2115643-Ditylum_brightwellii.AAC.1